MQKFSSMKKMNKIIKHLVRHQEKSHTLPFINNEKGHHNRSFYTLDHKEIY